MGCGIHTVLQKRTGSGEEDWTTVLVDCLQFGSSLAREFNTETQTIRTDGAPPGFVSMVEDETIYHIYHEDSKTKKYWMGEHSLGYFTLDRLADLAEPPKKANESFTVDKWKNTVTVTFNADEDNDDFFGEYFIYEIVVGLRWMFGQLSGEIEGEFYGLSNYRLVVGYDS